MTNEKAIRILNPSTTIEALAEIEYYGGFNGKEAKLKSLEDAIDMAISALEKQIKKKPLRTEYGKKYDVDYCPECQSIVRNSEYAERFCSFCGQALDWSADR